ncbi:peptidylprolyl isomerase, partial [Parendozoicomonas sp. Alg238-R29]|uniref:peptidylprolyl isomerase n=1 Tax=Parendozoicomonas sp. Alg238-R29 TaxID=2993446 RepID=UPI00248E2FE1
TRQKPVLRSIVHAPTCIVNRALPVHVSLRNSIDINGQYGSEFTEALMELQQGDWYGPIKSTYGNHFVRINQRIPPHLPSLDDVRRPLTKHWQHQQIKQKKDDAYTAYRAKYNIVIEQSGTDSDV